MVRQRRLAELFGWLRLGVFLAFVQRLSPALISYSCPCSPLYMGFSAWHGPRVFCDRERIKTRAQRMAVVHRSKTSERHLKLALAAVPEKGFAPRTSQIFPRSTSAVKGLVS